MACFLIAYSLCGTRRAHTNCRLQIPTLRIGICKCIHALASPNIARSCNIRAKPTAKHTQVRQEGAYLDILAVAPHASIFAHLG